MLSVDFTNLNHKNYQLVTYSTPPTSSGAYKTKSFLQASSFDTDNIESSFTSSPSSLSSQTITNTTASASIWDSSIHEMDSLSYITQLTNNNTNNSLQNNANDNSLDYALKLKEIEDYYLKSLLNDDTNNNSNVNHINTDINNNNNNNNNNSFYSNYPPSSLMTANQNQMNSIRNDYQLPHYDRLYQINNSNNNNIDGRSLLEVDINHNFNNSLPLTTENLQKLSLSNDQVGINHNYNSNISLSYTLSTHFNNNNNNIPSNTFSNNITYPSQVLFKQHQQNTFGSNMPVLKNPPSKHQQVEINKQLYKTELCESFTTKGFCKYGNKCQFAHGLNELKFKHRSNNFRTKPCINWDKLGYCPYGKRCLFKHGDDRDIQIYLQAGTIVDSSNNVINGTYNTTTTNSVANFNTNEAPQTKPRRKNLHANVKRLQRITW